MPVRACARSGGAAGDQLILTPPLSAMRREGTVGQHKCDSAAQSIAGLNSRVQVELHRDGLTPENAVGIVTRYDVVVDASDNAPTRYLIRCTGACLARGCVEGAWLPTVGFYVDCCSTCMRHTRFQPPCTACQRADIHPSHALAPPLQRRLLRGSQAFSLGRGHWPGGPADRVLRRG